MVIYVKNFLKAAFIFFLCGSIFFGCSYFYLYKSLENTKKVTGKTDENVPYYELPDNCGLRFFMPGGQEIIFFLDFTEEISYIININDKNGLKGSYAGYTLDYDFTLDYSVLSELFDRLGGLDLKSDDGVLRFTGVQVCDRLCTDNSEEFSFEVVCAVCERIAKNGFSGDDFVYLLENSDTRLTVPVCIYWQPHLEKMFANAVFVNWVI